jgi:hypothetical protein
MAQPSDIMSFQAKLSEIERGGGGGAASAAAVREPRAGRAGGGGGIGPPQRGQFDWNSEWLVPHQGQVIMIWSPLL